MVRLLPDSIVYIIADGNYSNIIQVDGTIRMVTSQLGEVFNLIEEQNVQTDLSKFIRIGKSLIVNSKYIYYINVTKQRMVLSDGKTFTLEVKPSKDALKTLKEYLEKEVKK